ncbi:tRNA(Ser) Um(44) 2'-O-methyltransferase [Elasticomyces elasticus]|uniref:tRNA (uracil-O(2)-)-methyltransferase n=1 Tax=Elasticomyces elasticus TaxID=574655 RepID=A0AAN7VU63_9PEZI|nr:tRNA(Ser) Um(44) 2'-O-methyltransferase [Elasticomyces elasticus]
MAATNGDVPAETLFSSSLISPNVSSALPDGYSMRPLQRGDFDLGFLDVLRVLTHVGDVSKDEFEKRWDEMKAGGGGYHILVILDDEQKIVGTGALIVERKFIHHLGVVGHIEDIAVAKDQQGKKLGLRIIQALDYVAENTGCYKTILDCSEANEGFYVKCGFKRAGLEMAHYYGQRALSHAKFSPQSRKDAASDITLPHELWMTVLDAHCTFPPDIFQEVMLNIVSNPNVTSSQLFRADIFHDSGEHEDGHDTAKGLLKQMKVEYRPIDYQLPGFERIRTIVRQLIPRNPQLDRPLVQTCHFFRRLTEDEETSVVLYIPHVEKSSEMPFYHPKVSKLAFLHKWQHLKGAQLSPGMLSVSYTLFPDANELTTKLERTALRLLETVHKHGQGQLAGYEKKVHLDRIIPQKRYQDTYTTLKAKYGRQLSEQWVEVTDPGKHVFEDIGIAAFLIELWRDMYAVPESTVGGKASFPGFVDIGCGNGVLTYILISEGYRGSGFDARERKTWSIFPADVRDCLQQRLLVPEIFLSDTEGAKDSTWHSGVFDEYPGAFIVSNHADELTAWTPLLAHLNKSAFIAIPCCSHDLAGTRFRASPTTKSAKTRSNNVMSAKRLPQQQQTPAEGEHATLTNDHATKSKQGPETGSLKRTAEQKKMPSAYSTLCSYVESLAEEVGFEAEQEVLRIPSTRNLCILGRTRRAKPENACIRGEENKQDKVVGIVESELGKSVTAVGAEWIARAEKLAKKPGSGH